MSSRVRHANSQDNPKSDRSSPRINPQARRILLNLAPTWTGSPILKPVLQSAFDILDIVEDPKTSSAQWVFLHHCIDTVKVLNDALQPDPSITAPFLRRRIDNFKVLLTDIQEAVQANQPRAAILSFLRLGRDDSLDLFEQRLLEAHGYFAITAEPLVTTDVNWHHDRPPAKPDVQQDQQDHNRGGSQMFQSSRNLDFTGGTFYSAENVQIVRTEVAASNVDITENLSRIQTKLNHLLLFHSIVILF